MSEYIRITRHRYEIFKCEYHNGHKYYIEQPGTDYIAEATKIVRSFLPEGYDEQWVEWCHIRETLDEKAEAYWWHSHLLYDGKEVGYYSVHESRARFEMMLKGIERPF